MPHSLTDEHRRGFLDIVEPGMEQRVEGEGGAVSEPVAPRAPRRLLSTLQSTLCLERVEAHAHGSLFLQSLLKDAIELLAHELLRVCCKFGR